MSPKLVINTHDTYVAAHGSESLAGLVVPMSFRPVSDPNNNLDGASESDLKEIYLKTITSVPGAAVYGQYTAHLQGLTKMSRIIAVCSRYAAFKRVPELDQDEQYTKFDSTLMM